MIVISKLFYIVSMLFIHDSDQQAILDGEQAFLDSDQQAILDSEHAVYS